jgi:hypothetical protein
MSAPLPTPSGVVRTHIYHTLNLSTPFAFHFDAAYGAGPPGTDDLNIAAASVRTAYVAHLLSMLSGDATLDNVTVTDLAHPATPEGIVTGTTPGTRTGTPPLPANCCAVLSFGIARRYRGSRPKLFAPWGLQVDTNTYNAWGTSFQTEVVTKWTAFLAALSGVSFGDASWGGQVGVSYIGEPYSVVVSPTTGRARNVGTARNPPGVYPVTSTVLSPTIGSQRRRLR